MLPKVSVIIPTYNYANYIADAINSILNQSYPQELIQIIVIDDGSSDNTRKILCEWIDKGTIKYYYQQNKGKANATSSGIQKSLGKYIFNLDADDWFFPEKVAISVNIFEKDHDIVHVASAANYFYENTGKSGNEFLPPSIVGIPLDGAWLLQYFYNNKILFGGGSTYVARASALKKINIPAAVDMYIDEFLLLTILPMGKSFFNEQSLSAWRIHASNYSGKTLNMEMQRAKIARLMNSSAAVFSYLKKNNYDERLIKIYHLQHITRQIAFKEALNEKGIIDIIQYAKNVFFKIKPGVSLIKKHNVLNRLIPTSLFLLLKKIYKGKNAIEV